MSTWKWVTRSWRLSGQVLEIRLLFKSLNSLPTGLLLTTMPMSQRKLMCWWSCVSAGTWEDHSHSSCLGSLQHPWCQLWSRWSSSSLFLSSSWARQEVDCLGDHFCPGDTRAGTISTSLLFDTKDEREAEPLTYHGNDMLIPLEYTNLMLSWGKKVYVKILNGFYIRYISHTL